jgi:O-antigen ligase
MAFLNEVPGQYLLPGRRPLVLLITVLGAAVTIGAVAAQQPLLAAGAVLAMVLTMAAIAWPDFPSLILIFILYTNAAVVAVKFHGVPFIIGASLPVLLVIPLANYLIFRRQRLVFTPVLALIFLFLVIHVLGTLFSQSIRASMPALITFVVEGIGLYFLITNVVRTPKMLRRAIWVAMIAGGLMGGLSLFQQVTGTFANNYWGFAQAAGEGFGTGVEALQGEVQQMRLAGPIGEKNRYAQIMLMLLPLGLFQIWSERSIILRVLAAIATGLMAIGAVLAFSRGAAVAFMVVLIMMTFLRYVKPYQLAIVLLGLVLVLQVFPQYGVRLTSLQALSGLTEEESAGVAGTDSATQRRFGEMYAAALVFADYPIIGVGPGMFRYYYQDYVELTGFRIHVGRNRQAHNLYLGIAAENGGLGLICFLAILYVTLRNLARTRKQWLQTRPELAYMATGFLMSIAIYMTTGFAEHMSYIRYFWLTLALAEATSYVAGTLSAEMESTGRNMGKEAPSRFRRWPAFNTGTKSIEPGL